ncbi:MAG TPA: ABC transporter ATP-binding protein [Syntrophorhabdus sp.]|jgi:branched-chain amino acid transport system ATP-binding protein|nr:ABC transporter ATP-binding protein [Syntrophorhabdus sp.]MDI9559043.1 ABC transporter ATP-binding protein [Pseudomonadota bacterium]OPX93377.1 MAG: High-affinity branched-chain amino acid transport ATP-binding protein LivF [Syntrophorhabdus sp. PtaB.Bin027]OQB77060.1 MAG: High-affinity branched-chain amino acid transport ATP-binding protein LivF [Deltaproteobacteria bacterium ADurb.Bin135]NMC94111.1 ABC transporter ATP-binding protein [Syntrophorhabdus sp.]
MLKLTNISTSYGKVRVLREVSLEVAENEIVALVGANGAGKSTMLNTISGIVNPTSGSIEFLGKRIDGMPPYDVLELGISQVPEGGKPFPDMTVRENLEMGAYSKKARKFMGESLERVFKTFPILKERGKQLARTLSGGQRQMLAMGRCLMSRPRLAMFDEPSYGLAPVVVGELFTFVQELRNQGIAILLVEQNIRHALETADRGYVLENGQIVLEGSSRDLLSNDHVRKAYLGI